MCSGVPSGIVAAVDVAFFDLREDLSRGAALVRTLVVLAPLAGLLGTVTGMIETFESLASIPTLIDITPGATSFGIPVVAGDAVATVTVTATGEAGAPAEATVEVVEEEPAREPLPGDLYISEIMARSRSGAAGIRSRRSSSRSASGSPTRSGSTT